MTEYLRNNIQFLLMILVWIIAGNIAAQLAILVVLGSVILLKRKNMYAEMITGFILILILSDSWQPELAFAKDAKTLYLLLLTGFVFFDKKQFRVSNKFFLPFIPFFIWGAAQFIRSPETIVSFQKTLSYALLFLVAPTYFFKLFRDTGPAFLKNHVMLICLVLISGLIMYVIFPEKVIVGARYSGVMGNPNGMGLLCTTFFILFQIINIKFPDLFKKNDKLLVYGLIGISVLMCGSRNTILSIGIFLLFSRFYKLSPYFGFTVVVLVAILYQFVISSLPDILEAVGLAEAMRVETLESGSGRLIAWGFAWEIINSNMVQFFCGRGFGFDEYIFIQNKEFLATLGHIGGVHNTFLALWMNTGLIGLILWIAAFIRLFAKAIPLSYAAFPLLYTVVFSATFEAWLMGSLNPYTITFLFVMSLIITPLSDFAGEEKTKEPGVEPDPDILITSPENQRT